MEIYLKPWFKWIHDSAEISEIFYSPSLFAQGIFCDFSSVHVEVSFRGKDQMKSFINKIYFFFSLFLSFDKKSELRRPLSDIADCIGMEFFWLASKWEDF